MCGLCSRDKAPPLGLYNVPRGTLRNKRSAERASPGGTSTEALSAFSLPGRTADRFGKLLLSGPLNRFSTGVTPSPLFRRRGARLLSISYEGDDKNPGRPAKCPRPLFYHFLSLLYLFWLP